MNAKNIYNISKSKIEGKTANEIADELYSLPPSNTPARALAYSYVLSIKAGCYCREIDIKAISDYLQIERRIKENDPLCTVFDSDKNFYLENKLIIDIFTKTLNKLKKLDAIPNPIEKNALIETESINIQSKLIELKKINNNPCLVYSKFIDAIKRML